MRKPVEMPVQAAALMLSLLLGACGGGGGGGTPSAVSANDPNAPTVVAGPNGSTIVTNPTTTGTTTTGTTSPGTTTTSAPPAGGTLIIPPPTGTLGTGATTGSTTTVPVTAEAAASRLLPLLITVPLAQFTMLGTSIDGDMMVQATGKACPTGGTVRVTPFDANDKVVARADSADVDFKQCGYRAATTDIKISGLGIWGIAAANKTATQSAVTNITLMLDTDYSAATTAGTVGVKSGVTAAMILDLKATTGGPAEVNWAIPTAGTSTTYVVTESTGVTTIKLSDLNFSVKIDSQGVGTYAIAKGSYEIQSPTVNGSGTFTPRTLAGTQNDQKLLTLVLRAR